MRPGDGQIYSQVSMMDTAYYRDSVPDVPPPRRSRSIFSMLREWWWEFLSWGIGTCALAAIGTLLYLYRNKPVASWNFELRLATVIAALSQVAQTALMVSVSSSIGQLKWPSLRRTRPIADIRYFDEATRGASGSALLLWKTLCAGRIPFASVGAIVTILMLAFSSFTQQSVTIKLRTVDSGLKTASVNRVLMYDDVGGANSALYDTRHQTVFDQERGAAATLGWIQNYLSPSNSSASCPTDYCTWKDYTTLAMCAYTEDVSSGLTLSRNKTGVTVAGLESKDMPLLTSQRTAWMTTNLTTTKTRTMNDIDQNKNTADIYFLYHPLCNANNQNYTGSVFQQSMKEPRNWKAFKGTFKPCLQTMRTSFNLSTQTKITVSQRDLTWRVRASPSNGHDVHCYKDEATSEEYCLNTTTFWESIKEMFRGNASLIPGGDNYFTGEWMPIILPDIFGPILPNCDLSPERGLVGFNKRLNNIAYAITNSMRASSKSVPVTGTAWRAEQYFHVQYIWLSLPGGLWVTITLFFLTTFARTRNAQSPIWKSSPLVLLECMNKHNAMDRIKNVEKSSEKNRVQLKYTGENWYLQKKT
ncbi:hypothetical protein B0J11DRAFT_584144 [Dendryphion nanum]|uniref:Uncharacterized protein n=1 Tax=Dendryphion nanum TaxID=256645 RepID=A0A9P9DBV5_9PLEO|nr:hypothetical protein B0J11DRAFT_584144 [Dendryphion nanum]